MSRFKFLAVVAIAISIALSGCKTIVGENTRIANPNNVYRFAENTELKVLIQDEKTGTWKNSDYKVIVPMGYYIGSGLE